MTGPDPAVAALRSAVRAELVDVPSGRCVLVACSGGPDSLALAAVTAFVARRAGITVGAVVVDHGWQAESGQVAQSAARACRALGLDPVDVVRVAPSVEPRAVGGPEAVARDARYAALEAAAERHAADVVLLGHTLDDQAETVLLGLARGSGARSLAGMPTRRGVFRRPLLAVSRDTTSRACAALGLEPWIDPANTDPAYARARVRAAMRVLQDALGPGLPAALARTADQLRADAVVLEALAAELLAAAGGGSPDAGAGVEAGAGLDVAVLAGAPEAVRRRALLLALRTAGCPGAALGSRHVLAVDALVITWRGQGPVHLPGGVVAGRDCGRLRLVRRPHGLDPVVIPDMIPEVIQE